MDCEKFESTLMDELYGELDELTSAASKRHVASCARCASLLHGLSATRRIAVLELVEPPPGLEQRILAATKEAQKVVPLRGRISRMVSWAGSWAMRPQTAMAAVFLLMIGTTSVLLLRARQFDGGSMVVTEKGAPATAASAASEAHYDEFDSERAAGAHGAVEQHRVAPAPPPPPAAAVNADDGVKEATSEVATHYADKSAAGDAPARLAASGSDEKVARAYGPVRGPVSIKTLPEEENSPASAAAPAPRPEPQAPPAAQATDTQPTGSAMPMAKGSGGADGAYDTAMANYRAKNYSEATRGFDALAAAGNTNAALMAARSVRDSTGCADALPRYNAVIARAHGTQAGYDAALEAGRCERVMGSLDSARSRFAFLLTVPSHAARAQAELDQMSPRQANKRATKPVVDSKK